jgi:transcription antitermination factor NusG
MQKNWYLVYTKPKCEKKVSASLTKRKIENFCPQNRTHVNQIRRNRLVDQPLFNSYVFIYIEEEKISLIKQTENILNLVYWKGPPAIIKEEEINIIKGFINDHHNIRLEKTKVNQMDLAKLVDRPGFTMDGNLLTIKNKSIKVNLPSIGYTLIAEIEREEEIIGRKRAFNQEFSLQ